MRVWVSRHHTPIGSRIESRSPLLQLAGHGNDSASADESLRRTVRAWCVGLQVRGELEPALRSRGMRWDPEGSELEIEILS